MSSRAGIASLIALVAITVSGCGIIKARVIVDGKHYDMDGTPRVPPKQRVKDATTAMTACSEEVRKAESVFARDAAPAIAALSASLARGAGGGAAVSFAELTEDPLIRAQVDAKPAAKAAPRATKRRPGDDPSSASAPPFAPLAAALSTSLRQSLEATTHCSAANLAAIKAVWDEQSYISQEETHELLEAHWRATQSLNRSKELSVSCIALGVTMADAGRGKSSGLAAAARILDERRDRLFTDVAFDHNLRREVMIQALRDTSDGCGTKDEKGKTTCDKAADAIKTAKTAVDAVHDVQAGRILAALQKALALSDDGETKLRRDQARREAVLPLIPETPALDRSREVLDAARAGKVREAKTRGGSIASSDGVLDLLAAMEK